MGYITETRTGTRTQQQLNTGTRTAYKTAYETMEANLGFDLIPIIRPNFSYFSFSGLRPNSPHWIFFDGKQVTHFCNTSYNSATYNTLTRNNSIRNPGDKYIHETGFPAELGGPTAAVGQPVYSDASGNLDGLFYIQSNSATSFPTGNRSLVVSDLSILDKEECLSWAQAEYSAVGEYELYYQYQQAYQQAYSETYQYTTSYEEEYQYNVQTWVDDPPPYVPPYVPDIPPPPPTPVVPSAPVAPIPVPPPPPDPEPPVTTPAVNSGATETTTTKSSRKGGGGSKMVLVTHTEGSRAFQNGKETTYYMSEDAANARVSNSSAWSKPKKKKKKSKKSIVCTEMYRQTQMKDWAKAMKIWDVYQKRYLTSYHEIGYHWLFKPYVLGMQRSTLLTKLGAYLAKERTQHLKYVLTKGKANDSLVGNLWCKIIHPIVYIAGIIKTSKLKIMADKRVKV